MWVYRKLLDNNDNTVFEVGYYEPTAKSRGWVGIKVCYVELDARYLVHYLNGGSTS
jgi:hypothetical protein